MQIWIEQQGSAREGSYEQKKLRRRSSNTVKIDDCQFHQCVKLGKFDSDRTIGFISSDGEFELTRYRASDNFNLPFKVHPVVTEIGKSKVE
ncbi:hypothetical protein BGZ98_007987 [Dissophora globulifera]|nr:hypothetical protein BGZ98_007987 [Dissophora globulifera]